MANAAAEAAAATAADEEVEEEKGEVVGGGMAVDVEVPSERASEWLPCTEWAPSFLPSSLDTAANLAMKPSERAKA